MPVLHLEGFDGPMDLLLDLAERQRIDLGRISIVALAEQFVAALTDPGNRVPLDRRADWVVLAARLVQLRARLLFPADPAEQADAQAEAAAELHRLEAMRFVRAAGHWLATRPQLGWDVFAPPPPARDPRSAGVVALMEACLAMLRGHVDTPEQAPSVYRPPWRDPWSVTEARARIRAKLHGQPEGEELTGYVPALPQAAAGATTRAAIASTLLASLELAKEGEVSLAQETPWEGIRLSAAKPDPPVR